MSYTLVELSVLGFILIFAHFQLRRRPLWAHAKIVRTIQAQAALGHQIRVLTQDTPGLSSDVREMSLAHFNRRHQALGTFILTQLDSYRRLYRDPYKRLILRLPPPPNFIP